MAIDSPQLIGRREFLAGAGAGLGALLLPSAARALASAGAVYVSAFKAKDGTYGAAVLTADGKLLHQAPLPGRGHGFAVHRPRGRLVGFARRPGSFAIAFADDRLSAPRAFATPQGRHFFGHGLFSADGALLYTTENDFENAAGIIGVYDATNGYARIGEFPSFGIDPHDMVLMDGGQMICIANGGIITHPDSGRAKLNLAEMQPPSPLSMCAMAYSSPVTNHLRNCRACRCAIWLPTTGAASGSARSGRATRTANRRS